MIEPGRGRLSQDCRRWLPRAAAVLLVALVAAADDTPPKDLRYYIQQANAAHEKQDWTGFLESYLEAAKLAPRSLRVIYNLACGYALNGKPAEDHCGCMKLVRKK